MFAVDSVKEFVFMPLPMYCGRRHYVFGLFVRVCIRSSVHSERSCHSILKSIGHTFNKLAALVHFRTRMNALSFVVKILGHDGSNMLENALFGLVNVICPMIC